MVHPRASFAGHRRLPQFGILLVPRMLGLVLAFLSFSGKAIAASLSGGGYEIRRDVVAPGGGVSGGAYRTTTALRDALGVTSGGASLQAMSGLFVPVPGGASVTSVSAPARVCTRIGTQAGVPSGGALEVAFTSAIEPASLARAATVQAASAVDGNPTGAVPFSVEFDTRTLVARFNPVGGWRQGTLYRVLIGSGVVDLGGAPISGQAEAGVMPMMDFSPSRTVSAFDDGSATLQLPSGALGTGSGFLIFHSSPATAPDRIPSGLIAQADARAGAAGRASLRTVEINAYDSSCSPRTESLRVPALLSLGYRDADGDGFVDGHPGARVRSLALWHLDEDSGNWLRVPGSRVDESAAVVQAPLQHFSVYALAAVPDQEVSASYAYPVPWRPYSGDAARHGTLSGGITFANLPQTGSVSVYTIGGELVRRQELSGALKWVWDVRNVHGEAVASGVFLWSVRSGDKAKTGKLMVIR